MVPFSLCTRYQSMVTLSEATVKAIDTMSTSDKLGKLGVMLQRVGKLRGEF